MNEPTFAEIAEWLRVCATKAALLKLYQECSNEELLCEEAVWLGRAAQVEAMGEKRRGNLQKESHQVCCDCGSTHISKNSSAMGFHVCNACGSTVIRWT